MGNGESSLKSEGPRVLEYGRAPRWGRVRRWIRRGVIVIAILLLLIGSGVGWTYWEWREEQENFLGGLTEMDLKLIGPEWIQKCFGDRYVWMLARVDFVSSDRGTTDYELGHYARFKYLRRLWVIDSEITDDGMKQIETMSQLEDIALGGRRISDLGLANFSGLNHLRYLRLSGTKISGRGLIHLKRLSAIEILEICECPITDDGLKAIAAISKLKEVILTGTSVTGDGIRCLRVARPDLKVKWDGEEDRGR